MGTKSEWRMAAFIFGAGIVAILAVPIAFIATIAYVILP
ncbi:hypothetical protein PAECIP111892_01775 [Paenibacillus auburnensis]|uniref:Uncharacterized protein n=1 Tax=Paenibacillus auburnensis TaxID=2905649 RepID=A0ABM9BTG0_9BACL|nr:hypothetical protein PAECIP111892_01775 [Paenibacillus auburnensis]